MGKSRHFWPVWLTWLVAIVWFDSWMGNLARVKAAGDTTVCSSVAFGAIMAKQLGSSPINIRSLVVGDQVCIQFSLPASKSSDAEWFSIGLGRRERMYSSPACTAFLLQKGDTVPVNYKIKGYLASQTVKQQDQSVFTPFSTNTNGGLVFTYQRSLAAATADEVAIDPAVDSMLIWAYGDSWPITGHKAGTFGIETYNFGTGTSPNAGGDASGLCGNNNCASVFGVIAFAVMLVGGAVVLLTRKNKVSHWLLHHSMLQVPKSMISNAKYDVNPLHMLCHLLGDLFPGELLVALVFVGAFIALAITSKDETNMTLTGRLSALLMMFLFVPVSRVPWLWDKVFGSSFERVIKFHRWLGISFTVLLIAHILVSHEAAGLWSSDTYNTAVPLHGTISFICFIVLVVLSLEPVRRLAYEVFYYTHRVLLVVGTVFAILHANYVGYPMIFSLTLYGLGLFWRWLKCVQYFRLEATLKAQGNGLVTISLQPNAKTKALAGSMDPCSYFWLFISDISPIEWHPFSAVATPHSDSIGFVVKSMGPKTFSQRLVDLAKTSNQTRVTLCGPFGQIAVRLEDYDAFVFVAGGVGITPLLSLLNQNVYGSDLSHRKVRANQEFFVVWSVRDPSELLMVDALMAANIDNLSGSAGGGAGKTGVGAPAGREASGPVLMGGGGAKIHAEGMATGPGQGPKVQWLRHVTSVKGDSSGKPLSVLRSSGEQLSYKGGRPALDLLINTSRFGSKKVGVLACGPPTLVGDAQKLARECGFDFHKEVFTW